MSVSRKVTLQALRVFFVSPAHLMYCVCYCMFYIKLLFVVREEHRCKSFKWFMEEIAYDIPQHYPLPPKNVEWGEVGAHKHKRIK